MGWLYALGYKVVAAVLIAAGYYVLILLPLRWLHRRLPDNRFVRFLFRERGRQGAGPATDLRQGRLDDPPLIGRE
jgi:hypothetical protein